MKKTIDLTLSLFRDEDVDAREHELQVIKNLITRGATFVINHSGGKDSQAMFNLVSNLVPRSQIYVLHAALGVVEWPGVIDHIKATIHGHELKTCRSRRTLIEMIKERGMFPSPSMRQCTSDLKRGPIERTIRQSGNKLIVNCMGMRSEESTNRAKLATFKLSEKNSKNGREWYDWLPIHHWRLKEVFDFIEESGQKPHYAYALGMTRLSCAFCIMASKEDLTTSAKHNHKVFRIYVDLERETGHVMVMPTKGKGKQTLEEITGVIAKTHQELEAA